MAIRYLQALKRPGLYSANFKPLKTWHAFYVIDTPERPARTAGVSLCDEVGVNRKYAAEHVSRRDAVPEGGRLCRRCEAVLRISGSEPLPMLRGIRRQR